MKEPSDLFFRKRQNDIREVESARFIAELTGQAHLVLNIGPTWGRDYYALAKLGKHVINLDIATQHNLPNVIVADASTGLPFATGSFDAILLPEILEHLIQDWVALREAHRVLKDDGALIVTVPFYADTAPYHVRVHSAKSILRLMATAGFSAQRVIYRGGWIRIPRFVHGIRKFLSLFNLNHAWYRFVVASDRWWGEKRQMRRLAIGVYILAHKGDVLDWRRINRENFKNR